MHAQTKSYGHKGPPAGFAPESDGAAVINEQAWTEAAHSLRLSRRELQITRGVFADSTDFAIASDLGMSRHTVHAHMRRLFQKLAVTSRVQWIVRIVAEVLALTALARNGLPPICSGPVRGRCRLDLRRSHRAF